MFISLHSIPTLIGALFALVTGLFVFLKDPKSQTHIAYFAFCLSLFGWLFGYTLVYSSKNAEVAMRGARVACSLSGFTAPAFYHLAVSYLKKKDEYKYVIISYLIMSVALVFFITTPLFLSGTYKYFWGFYSKAGILHPLFLTVFFAFAFRGFYLLYLNYRKRKQLSQKESTKTAYVFAAYFIAMFGTIDYIIKYGVEFYPFGWVFEVIFAIIIAYAITKHELMDIRLVIGKTFAHILTIIILGSAYVAISSTYLNLTHKFDWGFIALTIIYGIFVGEFFQRIRQHIQTPVDRFFIKATYNFPDVSRKMASKFRQSLTHKDIIKNIYPILSDTVDIQNIHFFFMDSETENLVEWDINTLEPTTHSMIEKNDPLIKEILLKKDTVQIPKNANIKGELAIPSLGEDKVLALIIAGKKRSEDDFTHQDYDLFTTISEYISIALEYIIKPYEEVQRQFEMSERKLIQAERELYRSQRLASLGTLTAGVTHEIRNPLGVIRSGLEILAKKPRDPKYLDEFRDKYVKCVDRIENIVQKVLGLAREETTKTEKKLNLNALIDETLHLLQMDDNIKIIKELQPIQPIKGVSEDIERVLINLLENSKYAMPNGGILTIKSYNKHDQNEPTPKVMVEISDTGIGIPEKNIEKIFDPFYSSRHEGTGLGLPISYRIVKEHGGDITVKSREGKGTTFFLSFNAVT